MQIDEKTKLFILKHESDDVRQLALNAKADSEINLQFAIQQIAGRQIAKQKIPTWYNHIDIIYPRHLSLEQCSSERTAIYKAGLCKGKSFLDLTGGMGVDFSFMAENMAIATYVENQTYLVELAKHNCKVLNLPHTEFINDNSINYLYNLERKTDTIYIDPARRSSVGRRTILIEDCSPNLIEIDQLLNQKSDRTIIKLSPMLDISIAINALSNIKEIHIVSVRNECKEFLLIKEENSNETEIHCVNLLDYNNSEVFSFKPSEEISATVKYTNNMQEFLYEPNNSLMKAGCFKSIASSFNIQKLHPNSHLYTSDSLIENFPGRRFRVLKSFSPSKKSLKLNFETIQQANISVRNFPISVAELRKQTKLKDGGNLYVFATTLFNDQKVLILCEKIEK